MRGPPEGGRDYRDVMIAQGVRFNAAPESALSPIWCAWGYGRKIEPSQIYNALPIVKKLGFTWVTLDDGWHTAQGDWFLQPQKFPKAVGIGGALGTNFTWPEGSAERKRNDLTPAGEQRFEKWIGIYKEKMLSRGE